MKERENTESTSGGASAGVSENISRTSSIREPEEPEVNQGHLQQVCQICHKRSALISVASSHFGLKD